jgi:hypothetical protein
MNFLRKYLIRDGRVRLPDRIWLVAIITFLASALAARSYAPSIQAPITFAVVLFLTVQAKKYPKSTSAIYIFVFILISQVPALFNELTAFWMVVFVSILANYGHVRLAWICTATNVYFGNIKFLDGIYFPTSLPITFANVFIFAGAILIGAALYNERVKQAALVEQMRERREILTRALHDSVAAKLSSVILRSETLGLTNTIDPSTKATLALIAEEARLAIGDVRQLLEAIKTNNEFAPPTAHTTLIEQISEIINMLESHKLRTIWNNQLSTEMIATETPDGFSNVLSELAMNAIKYSPPESIVQITTSFENTFLFVEITNVASKQQASHYLTSGLGLEGIAEWAKKNRAQYHHEQHDNIWLAKVGFPINL